MSLKFFSKRMLIAAVLASATGFAIAQPTPPKPAIAASGPATAPLTPPENTTGPANVTIPNEIATVNGTPITSSEFIQALYVVAGPRVLGQMLDVLAAHEGVRLSGLTVDEKTAVPAERTLLLSRLLQNVEPKPTKALTTDEENNLLGQYAQRQGMTPMELGWKLQQIAYLRALGKAAKAPDGTAIATVTAMQLNDEFQRQYGDKSNVKAYVFEDPKQAQEITDISDKTNRPFNVVADEKKIRWQGVIIPKDEAVKFEPAKFKEAIKDLKKGQHSAWMSIDVPNKPGTSEFVVLYIDDVIPKADLKPNEIEQKKAELKSLMQDSAEVNTGATLVNQMRQADKIHIVVNDPMMAAYIKNMMAMQQANASQPATGPATGPATPGH